jgi:ataxin-3
MAEGGGSSGVVMVEALLYHEVQESRLCAVHCVNAVLQGPYFSEVDLASMAQDLDQQEQQVMLESGAGSSHYLNFMAEGSSNVAADGNFSIQVLNRALEIWSLQCISLEAPEAEEARLSPHKQKAFICNLQVSAPVTGAAAIFFLAFFTSSAKSTYLLSDHSSRI